MATVCAKILKHHFKADGTYNIKIRVTHKNEKRHIDTEHFVVNLTNHTFFNLNGEGSGDILFMISLKSQNINYFKFE